MGAQSLGAHQLRRVARLTIFRGNPDIVNFKMIQLKNQTRFIHEIKMCESLLKCLSDSVSFHIIRLLVCPKFVLIPLKF